MSLPDEWMESKDKVIVDINDYGFDEDELLLSYQKKWIADESKIKIAEKSRRTGLTWAEAADAVLNAASDRSAGGGNHFYVGSGKDMAIEFIEACAMWSKAFNRAAGEIQEGVLDNEDKDILTYTIRFSSGFKIQALSSKPSNMRGRQGNVTIDEAAFHDKLDEVLKAALALTMWGSKVRIISTHNGWENLFNELIQDTRAGKKRYSIHRIPLEKAVQQGLYKRICQITGEAWSSEAESDWVDNLMSDTASKEDADEEYGCIPKKGGGAYLSRALIESRMFKAPVIRYEGTAEFNTWPEHLRKAELDDWCKENLLPLLEKLNPEEQHAFGEDFARSGDLTVIAPMAISQQLKRKVPFLVELKNVPFTSQEQILNYIADRLPRMIGGALDARGNGQYMAEQARFRYGSGRIQEVMLSQGWYLENMPKMKSAFEDDNIAIPKDAEVLNDLRAVQLIKGIPKVPDGQTSKGRHGDAAIAIALAYCASMSEFWEADWQSVPKGSNDTNNDSDDYEQDNGHFGKDGGF